MSDTTTDTTQQTDTTTTPEGGGGSQASDRGDRGSVPYSRFHEVYDGLKQAKTEIEAMRVKLSEADVHRQKADELAAELAAVRQSWDEEKVFTGVGLTDAEGQDTARFFWGRVPETDRPEGGIGAWLADLKADPSKSPKALAPYLSTQVQQPEKPVQRQAPPQGPGPSRAVPAAVDVTPGAIREAAERARRSGDWTEFDKLSSAAMASRKK